PSTPQPPADTRFDAPNTPPAAPPNPGMSGGRPQSDGYQDRGGERGDRGDRGGFNGQRNNHGNNNGRRHRRGRGRGPRRGPPGGSGGQGGPTEQLQSILSQVQTPVAVTGEMRGWFDPARDGGFVRRSNNSYLAEAGDPYVPPHIVRQYALRRADLIDAGTGQDHRGRTTVVEVRAINGAEPTEQAKRPEFNSLPASYPERKLFLETGRPAKGGPELTRRAVDLIAPIGYGQRALIVAPARAGKTTLLHAITEGVALNHPNAA